MNYKVLTLDIMNWTILFNALHILNFINDYKDRNILYLIILCCFFYLIAKISKKPELFNIFHVFFAILMVTIPFITFNYRILRLSLAISIVTIITRKVFHGCILRSVEKPNSTISNNSFTKLLNWDIIFPVLALASTYRLYYNKSNTEQILFSNNID